MEANWSRIFDPRKEYNENLKTFRNDFTKHFNAIQASPFAEIEESFDFVGRISEGSYGTVVLCKPISTNKNVAIKILLKDHVNATNHIKHAISERKILYSTCFPFIVYLEFSFKNQCCLFLGMPFLEGELYYYHRTKHNFKEDEAKFYAAQIYLALEYLHNVNVIHRDLKPENILLDIRGYIRLTDFGFAKKIETRTYTFCGTPEYLAPEIINAKPYGKSVDWWSFGVILYEFVAGKSPFKSNDLLEMYDKIVCANYKIPNNFGYDLTQLIKNLLQPNISRRYGCMHNSVNDIKFHKWFDNIDWIAMLNGKLNAYYLPKLRRNINLFTKQNYKRMLANCNQNNDYEEEFRDF